MKEERTQTKVCVGVSTMWRAISNVRNSVVPKALPDIVKAVEVIEGDGGLGTILIFHFCGASATKYQREKIVEFDESKYKIGLQVIEGGKLNCGFSSYTTFFELTGSGDQETIIDIKVAYETETGETSMPSETTKPTLFYLKCLENCLLNDDAP